MVHSEEFQPKIFKANRRNGFELFQYNEKAVIECDRVVPKTNVNQLQLSINCNKCKGNPPSLSSSYYGNFGATVSQPQSSDCCYKYGVTMDQPQSLSYVKQIETTTFTVNKAMALGAFKCLNLYSRAMYNDSSGEITIFEILGSSNQIGSKAVYTENKTQMITNGNYYILSKPILIRPGLDLILRFVFIMFLSKTIWQPG